MLNAPNIEPLAYSSWERGLNENTNGLSRQYFLKESNFNYLSDSAVANAIKLLKDRRRKTAGLQKVNVIYISITGVKTIDLLAHVNS